MRVDRFFDTNIFVYAVTHDPNTANVAEALIRDGGLVSVQVMNEFVAVARRKLKLEWSVIDRDLASIRALMGPPVPVTADIHTLAFGLARADNLPIYDANIVAAALLSDCTTLYTEDMQHGRHFGPLTIVNPFAS